MDEFESELAREEHAVVLRGHRKALGHARDDRVESIAGHHDVVGLIELAQHGGQLVLIIREEELELKAGVLLRIESR